MQHIEKYKIKHLSKFSQLILLDDEAVMTSSCNSIFSTSDLLHKPVTDWFPFLESIFPQLQALKVGDAEYHFSKIETPLDALPGIYDFTFSRTILEGKSFLLWSIYDYTALYEDLKQYQQRRNELEIHRETLERRYNKLQSQNDILSEQNLVLENLNHLQLSYYQRIRSALQSPVNALDGLTFLLYNATLQNQPKAYIDVLRSSAQHLQAVIKELETITPQEALDGFVDSFEPRTIIVAVMRALHIETKRKLDVSFLIDEMVPQTLLGASTYLHQIFYSLLLNAHQYHSDSRLEVKMSWTSINDKEGTLHFSVTEFLGRIAHVFDQEEFTHLIFRLSVVKQLIDLQKGSISVTKEDKTLGIMVEGTLKFTKG